MSECPESLSLCLVLQLLDLLVCQAKIRVVDFRFNWVNMIFHESQHLLAQGTEMLGYLITTTHPTNLPRFQGKGRNSSGDVIAIDSAGGSARAAGGRLQVLQNPRNSGGCGRHLQEEGEKLFFFSFLFFFLFLFGIAMTYFILAQ